MDQQQLITQYLRLQRKLSAICQPWHSGRIDRLAGALRAVEQELRRAQADLPALPFARRLHAAGPVGSAVR